jgi:putative addiction module component (TIGR02574 family)
MKTLTGYNEVLSAALALKDEERAELAEKLFDSIEEEYDPELQAVLDRRWEELSSGKVKGIPAEECIASLRANLEETRAKRRSPSGGEGRNKSLRKLS